MTKTQITKSDIVAARIRVRQALDSYDTAWAAVGFSVAVTVPEWNELRQAQKDAFDLDARFAAQQRDAEAAAL